MLTFSERALLRQQLKRRGFDMTTSSPSGVRPRCSQCAASVISGLACHETGCHNMRRRRRR